LVYGCTETLKDELNSLLNDYRTNYAKNINKQTKPAAEKLLRQISVLKFQLNLRQRQYLVLKSLLAPLVADQNYSMSESTNTKPANSNPPEAQAPPPIVKRRVSIAFKSIHAELDRKLSVSQSDVMKNLSSRSLRSVISSSESDNSIQEVAKPSATEFDYRMAKKRAINPSLQLEMAPRNVSVAVYKLKTVLERKLSEGKPEAMRRFSKSCDLYNNHHKGDNNVVTVINPMAKLLNSSVKLDMSSRKSSECARALNRSSDKSIIPHIPSVEPEDLIDPDLSPRSSRSGSPARTKSPAMALVQQQTRPASGRPRSRGRSPMVPDESV